MNQAPRKPARIASNTKVFIVDDHPLVRDWLSKLIAAEPDLAMCGEAADPPQALEGISSARPDVVVADLSLNGEFGIELIKDIRARFPRVLVLVLSMHDEETYAERALRAGATGYVSKQSDIDNILTAIRRVRSGDVYLSAKMAALALRKFAKTKDAEPASEIESLSDRELEVFELIGKGKSAPEIAAQLHIGLKTVETYKTRLKEKLRLNHSREVLQHAVRWIVTGGDAQ